VRVLLTLLLIAPVAIADDDVRVSVNGAQFVLDARDAIEEGALAATAWEGVGIVNPGEFRASVVMSLRRGEQTIEQVPLQLEPKETRVIRIDRLFVASASGGSISFRSTQRVLLFGYANAAITPAAATTSKRRSVRSGSPVTLVHRSIVLTPSKDNTLYATADGSFSNGRGVHLFAGATVSGVLRRALLAFDVTSQIPPGSTVTRVVLTVHVFKSISGTQSMKLHRVTTDWGEGTSNAGVFRDGIGTSSTNGDATWVHTFFPNQRWTAAGGDFEATEDATATGANDLTWESAAMIARVQQWLDQPATNFGWIVIGKESEPVTSKALDAREAASATTRPSLTVEFNARQ
jgi:hypothetical protein